VAAVRDNGPEDSNKFFKSVNHEIEDETNKNDNRPFVEQEIS